MRTWYPEEALTFVSKNSSVKQDSTLIYNINTYFVKRGSAGNGVLGAIDFLNKHSDYTMQIVSEEKFATIK